MLLRGAKSYAQRNVESNNTHNLLAGLVAKWLGVNKICLISIINMFLAHLFCN